MPPHSSSDRIQHNEYSLWCQGSIAWSKVNQIIHPSTEPPPRTWEIILNPTLLLYVTNWFRFGRFFVSSSLESQGVLALYSSSQILISRAETEREKDICLPRASVVTVMVSWVDRLWVRNQKCSEICLPARIFLCPPLRVLSKYIYQL
jgi:hypothetical protein